MKPKRYVWTIPMQLEEMTCYVYVQAAEVKQDGHDRVIADGVIIDLPGEIKDKITKKLYGPSHYC